MGKGKGGGGGGSGANAGGNVVEANRKVEMKIKVLLEVRQPTKEDRRVAIKNSSGDLVSFNPFPGEHPQPTAFRKR